MATQESNWELVGPLATIDSTTMTLPNRFDQGSEIDAAVAVAAPDHHGDREAEQSSEGSPAHGDQHGAVISRYQDFT